MHRTILHRVILLVLAAGSLLKVGLSLADEPKPVKLQFKECKVPVVLDPERRGYIARGLIFSQDGSKIATGLGATLAVWNVADGRALTRMQLPEKQYSHAFVFADGAANLAWCSTNDPMVRVFDIKTGRQVREFPQPGTHFERSKGAKGPEETFRGNFVTFTPDGKRVVFSYSTPDYGLDLVDIATGKRAHQLKQFGWREACLFSPDGKTIASFSGYGSVQLRDARTGKVIRELQASTKKDDERLWHPVFSPDGRFLAACVGWKNEVKVWDVAAGKLSCTPTGKSSFASVAFTPDNQSLVTTQGKCVLYNLIAEKVVLELDPPASAYFATLSPDNKTVAILGPASDAENNWHQSIYLYELPAKFLTPAAAGVDDVALEKLWGDLGTDNELRLERILQGLHAAPQPTVNLLRKKLPPVAKERLVQVERWIEQLNDSAFAKRDDAMKELRTVVHDFRPLLEATRKSAGPGEIRNRINYILREAEDDKQPVALTRAWRALAVLEKLATPEARTLLKDLAGGASQAALTVNAAAALDRLTQKARPND